MNRRLAFAIGLLLQIAAVCYVFLPAVLVMNAGMHVTLRTVPVDPRSFFRGDYVILDYEIGRNLPVTGDEKIMYAVLEKDKDTEMFNRVGLSDILPTLKPGQACIKGVTRYNTMSFPDIAQFFVPEGTGDEWDQLRREQPIYIDISTDASCNAVIRGMRLDVQ
jgi:uncharacterized membrane-anchored protein